MELFIDYVKEKDGLDTILRPHSFLTYRVVNEQFYINDFHVGPEARKSPNEFFGLMRSAHAIAEEHGCTRFTCHVPLNTRNLNRVLISRLKFGFRVIQQEGDRLAMELPLKECEAWARQ